MASIVGFLHCSHNHKVVLEDNSDPLVVKRHHYLHLQEDKIKQQVRKDVRTRNYLVEETRMMVESTTILVSNIFSKEDRWDMEVLCGTLNQKIIKNKFSILVSAELLEKHHGVKFFSKLDLRTGYDQI